MSADTKAAMDDAIAAHFADECGGALVNAYVIQISGESMDDLDANQWSSLREAADGQAVVTTLGLLSFAKLSLEHNMLGGIRDE